MVLKLSEELSVCGSDPLLGANRMLPRHLCVVNRYASGRTTDTVWGAGESVSCWLCWCGRHAACVPLGADASSEDRQVCVCCWFPHASLYSAVQTRRRLTSSLMEVSLLPALEVLFQPCLLRSNEVWSYFHGFPDFPDFPLCLARFDGLRCCSPSTCWGSAELQETQRRCPRGPPRTEAKAVHNRNVEWSGVFH